MIPIQSAIVSYEELIKQGEALDNALRAAQNAADALSAMTTERNAANQALGLKDKALQDAQAIIAKHAATILDLQKLIPAPPVAQKITRLALPRFAGFTIEKGKESPSLALYTKVKTAMRWGAGMGFTVWRGFFNVGEVAEHLKTAPVYGNLIAYGQSLGLRFIADTIDNILLTVKDDVALKLYLDGLIKLGCEGVYINDANRAELPLETLKTMVTRIRKAAPDLPVFASLLATANLATYKAIVDHVEIQTFGTPSELSTFLAVDDALPYKVVMCLDARAPMTASDLAKRAALILKNPPDALFYYADLPGDYDAMPDEEDVILKGLVSLLKAR